MPSIVTRFGVASLPTSRMARASFGGVSSSDVTTFAKSCAAGAAGGAGVGTAFAPGVGTAVGAGAGCVIQGIIGSLVQSGVSQQQAAAMVNQSRAMIVQAYQQAYDEEMKKRAARSRMTTYVLLGGAALAAVALVSIVRSR